MNKNRRLPSKAAITVSLQEDNRDVSNGIQSICDSAHSLLNSQHPTKRQRKELLTTAQSLLELHTSVEEQIPSLLPTECTKCTVQHIQSESEYKRKTRNDVSVSRNSLRVRHFEISGARIALPENRVQYEALEICNILEQVELKKEKGVSLNKEMCLR